MVLPDGKVVPNNRQSTVRMDKFCWVIWSTLRGYIIHPGEAVEPLCLEYGSGREKAARGECSSVQQNVLLSVSVTPLKRWFRFSG